MIRTAVFLAASFVFIMSAQPAEKPKEARAALERKLHGEWIGYPCNGDFTIRADGTFERRHYSPGNHKLAGNWEVQWDELPPTLVLACKTSDYPDYVGKTSKVKLIQLDDEVLQFAGYAQRYERVRKKD